MIRDRHPSLARWAVDGGNGSVVSVDAMDETKWELCWVLLKSVLEAMSEYSLEAGDIAELMRKIETKIEG